MTIKTIDKTIIIIIEILIFTHVIQYHCINSFDCVISCSSLKVENSYNIK